MDLEYEVTCREVGWTPHLDHEKTLGTILAGSSTEARTLAERRWPERILTVLPTEASLRYLASCVKD